MANDLNLLEVEIAIYAIDRAGVGVLGENARTARAKLNRRRLDILRAAEEALASKREPGPLPLFEQSAP